MGGLSEPSTPDIPGLDDFEGTVFHSAQLGPRPRPRRGAGGGDRHRRLGDPVRARRSSRRSATLHLFQRTPSWVMPDPDRAVHATSSGGCSGALPGDPADAARRSSTSLHEATVFGTIVNRRLVAAVRGDRPPAPAQPGGGPRAAGQAHARLHARLQADHDVEHLLPGAHAAQRRGGHRRRSARSAPHSIVTADGERARGRHDHPRHRLQGASTTRRSSRVRGRDGQTLGETWEGSPRAYLGIDDRRLPQPLPARRPEQRRRLQLDHLHHEAHVNYAIAGAARDGPARSWTRSRSGPRSSRRSTARPTSGSREQRLERGRLRELVPRLERPQRRLVAGLHLAALAADAPLRPPRLPPAARLSAGRRFG